MEITRYHVSIDNGDEYVSRSQHGKYVRYDEAMAMVTAITSQLESVVAENAELKAAASSLVSEYVMNKGTDSEFIACVTPSKKTIGTGGVWDMWRYLDLTLNETPATDAFLAEVRASGVEMLLSSLPPYYASRADIEKFAAQLRQGGAV